MRMMMMMMMMMMGAYSAPTGPLAVLKGPTYKGSEKKAMEKGREGK